MQQAMKCATRVNNAIVASSKPAESVRPVPEVTRSRRSVLLGAGAGLAGLAWKARGASAAAPMLSDLVRPLVQDMDSNGNGILEVDEIRGAIQRGGKMTVSREAVIRDVMAPVDFDDDADVTVDEFSRGMALELEVDERWMGFMERDGQPGLSAEELAAGLGDLGEAGREVLPVAFKMADSDKDGRLSREEAGKAMQLIAYGVLGDYYDESGL